MKEYLRLAVKVIIIALAILLLWGFVTKAAMRNDECAEIKTKAELFEKAIGNFGALTPEEAALLWGKGVKERNGALVYAVMSDDMKKAYKEDLDRNFPSWVTGTSSPWVESYEIIACTKVAQNEYEIILQLNLASSAGSEGKHLVKLSVKYNGRFWVISDVKADDVILEKSSLNLMK